MIKDEFELDERTLPLDIQNDIKALVEFETLDINASVWDCLWGELYGLINASQHGREITKDVANYLRKKYLGLEND